MTDTELIPSQVDPEVSAAMVVYERLTPLQDALGLRDLTIAEMQLFAMVAHKTGLDPFTKQIYAIKRAGKVTHQTGIDGYRSVAERTREYAGSEEAEFEDCDCGQEPKGHPKVARVVCHRLMPSGHMVDQVGVARWHELYPGAGDVGQMWRKMPFNQLAKCAEANGLRKAFPRVLGGVYIAEEMAQAEPFEGTARAVAPDVKTRLAERRQAAIAPPAAAPVAAPPDEDDEVTQAMGVQRMRRVAPEPTVEVVAAPEPSVAGCGDEDASPMALGICAKPSRHSGAHGNADGTWPR